ncbi:uncharacterized protein IUM83_12769 [Phytophthora cinnamomi]|uniref:uncharacterized protein n=1 Tax=Phytophthora cinnamomi TaxID=4785 RepID=UPI00355981E8|nr:hypothetical protein IUM83_12769 [Phytophthora cinnamomi]
MFGKGAGDGEDSALDEVISAFDEADAEPSPANNDDSDFDEGKDSRQEEEGSSVSSGEEATIKRGAQPSVPIFFGGFPFTFESWDAFYEAFEHFQRESFQQFSKRTSTSVALRNKQIESSAEALKRAGKRSRKPKPLVPEHWIFYSNTLKCTHGQKYQPRSMGKRKHAKVRGTKCSATMNAHVSITSSGTWELRVSASGNHNHVLNEHLRENYAENRTIKDPQLKSDVTVLLKAGASAKGMLQYLRDRTGRQEDQDLRRAQHGAGTQSHGEGLTDAERALSVLDEFCTQNGGNAANVLVDNDTNVARVVTFQTGKMKRLFKDFPEVVLVDSTHNTNANRYKLSSFMVHGVFGKVCV